MRMARLLARIFHTSNSTNLREQGLRLGLEIAVSFGNHFFDQCTRSVAVADGIELFGQGQLGGQRVFGFGGRWHGVDWRGDIGCAQIQRQAAEVESHLGLCRSGGGEAVALLGRLLAQGFGTLHFVQFLQAGG